MAYGMLKIDWCRRWGGSLTTALLLKKGTLFATSLLPNTLQHSIPTSCNYTIIEKCSFFALFNTGNGKKATLYEIQGAILEQASPQ